MVDLRASNVKLKDRSERIIMGVCRIPRDDARVLLERAGGRVKTAIVMHRLGVDRDQAEEAIAKGGGVIRRVIDSDPPPVT
jgi:N-acetylmuramic acid 6-phosphate etherase